MAIAPDVGDRTGLADLTDGPGLVHLERLPARPARFGELHRPLPEVVWASLGVERLWRHQAQAIDLVRDGHSVVVATGTASGKSLCYQAPIAEAAVAPVRPGTSLCLFPTKALAQDQARALFALDVPGLVPATYDGDSSPEERTWARAKATVLLTNPEMLHSALLPHHARWSTYLARLQYVVVDELHVLRGIFGTHVAHLLRRLRRLCAHYGSEPTFVFSSATIGAPGRLASELCGLPVTEVTDDGSPRGERLVALWNPKVEPEAATEVIDPTDHDDGRHPLGPRRSTNKETAALVAELVGAGHRTIAFCRSRRGAEVVAAEVQRRLPAELRPAVRAYRGGYLAAERREIEDALFSGRLRAVVATTALELGIDVGGLDACVLNGFPGTIASLWQQAGRAGREGQESLAVLVAGDDQLDQWLMANPRELFTRAPEPAVINPANPYVLLPHLACAAYERPLTPADERWWGDLLDDGVRRLVLDDQLRLRPRRHEMSAVWSGRGWPAHGVGLRSGVAAEVRIVDGDGELVGTVDLGRAPSQVHPGATYLHQGTHWKVATLDLDGRLAVVEPHDGGEWTQPRSETQVRIAEVEQQRTVGRARLALGSIEVSTQVTGYRRRDAATGEVLGHEDLDLPTQHLSTRAVWYTVDPAVLAAADIAPAAVPGTLHAVEHCAIGMLPLFTICDRWDVGGVSTPYQADTGLPTIAIYDGYPGGAGIADLGYEAADRHLHATLEAVLACGCDDGCPSCVQSPKCGNDNEPLDKAGATRLLEVILG